MLVRSKPSAQEGFVLPLAITGALVLLLSSLSLQSILLHTRQVQAAERQRLVASDQLASAAQQVAAAFQGPFACLHALPSELWSGGLPADACPPDLDPALLQTIPTAGGAVHLIRWEPWEGGGQLELQLADQGPGLRRRFRLSSAGVRELG